MFIMTHRTHRDLLSFPHDALPISIRPHCEQVGLLESCGDVDEPVAEDRTRHVRKPVVVADPPQLDRKSTRLNSSHVRISYAVFCLKKKIKVNNDDLHIRVNDSMVS